MTCLACVQVFVGVLFILLGSLNINRTADQRAANLLNNLSLVIVFVITLVNVIISGFGIEHPPELLKNLYREDIIEP